MANSNKNVDLDDPLSLSDIEYKNLTGFTRTQHDRVLSYIPASALKTSINRSPRCAIACLLMKLRLALSNSVLASMLGIDNKRKVTDIIHSTSAALVKYFVLHYLGLAHINREEIIKKHTSSIATRLLTENRNPCILVPDGTYLYIQVQLSFYIGFATWIFSFHEQKIRNNQMQPKTFNLPKNRSLINDNDASILKHIMINNYDDILQWVEENDIMILDRGFRDSLGVLKSLGIDVAMPSFLGPKQNQSDVQDANNYRFVTILRWVVESVNARIKRFKWFNQVIPNSSLPSVQDFICIVAALLNCFHVSMVTPSPNDDETIRRMNYLRTQNNTLQIFLIDYNLTRNSIWNVIGIHNLVQRFPKLSMVDLRMITLGVYQMKRVRSYAEEHADSIDLTDPNLEFSIQSCTDTNAHDIIRIRFQSVHKKSTGIWFLGYERHQLETNQPPSSTNFANLHYCDSISDYEDSSDEDNDARYSYTR
ncbi:unnamed protein product [Rotaria socialis]|uniref:DDE Tnp4 domain-containing protein n=1 Tax=Rotaria socialis TaxID=392032 RepID=A0A821D6A7_9BILA|nr:unnamed protein product [Rotaria socialis]